MRVTGKCKYCDMPLYTEDGKCCYCGKTYYDKKYITEVTADEMEEYIDLTKTLPTGVQASFCEDMEYITLYLHDDFEDEFHFVNSKMGIFYFIKDGQLVNTIEINDEISDHDLFNNYAILYRNHMGSYYFYENGQVTDLSRMFALNGVLKTFLTKNNIELVEAPKPVYLGMDMENIFASARYYVDISTTTGIKKMMFDISRKPDGKVSFKTGERK